MLEPGNPAPDFSLVDSYGKTVSLSDFKGKKVVVYFYPKDDTPGCTREAIGFSEQKKDFDEKNTVVLGISKDSPESHQKFCTKYSLTISLLSDPEMDAIKAYDVWQEKNLYGNKSFGIVRSTFLVGTDGLLKKIWRNVKVDGHIDAVLKELL